MSSVSIARPSTAISRTDELTGQAITAFVTLLEGQEESDELRTHLAEHVAKDISPIARPKEVYFVPDLPKTRSGKIMRRLLRDIAEGRELGDTTTLANEAAVQKIADAAG